MADTGRLSEKIRSCLERHKDELGESQKLIDKSMNEMLEQRERFAAIALRITGTVIHPRMDELARNFENAAVSEWHGETDFHCVCEFTHTQRFPATVSFDVCLLPRENYTKITARYDLKILPVLMEYKRDEEKIFPLDVADEEIAQWVEDKIVECVDTYLRLETHPLYQKDNLVVDPVCGMQISAVVAACRIERPDRTIYFCSEACREAFLKKDRPD